MTQQNTIIVKSRSNAIRLDQFVIDSAHPVASLTRKEIQTHIESGKILLNERQVRPSRMVKPGDLVTILEIKKENLERVSLPTGISVLFENESFLALEKPAGLSMHPVREGQNGTLVHWILAKYPKIAHVGDDPLRPGIVHRLDKETSGLVLVAKNKAAFLALKKLFAQRQVEKEYVALVYGEPKEALGTITLPLGRVAGGVRRGTPVKKRAFSGQLREAVTEYTLHTAYPQFSLLSIKPKTGRTHQIRVHLAAIGHPVVGDRLYAFKKHKKGLFPEHQLLHAEKIQFTLFGQTYDFHSPLPTRFRQFLELCKIPNGLPSA